MTEEEARAAIATELGKPAPDWQAIETASRFIVEADPDNVRFTVDAGHIQRLGAELVGKQDTALSELIKNAYDADATKVTLTFHNQDQVGGSLIISDDGVGMVDSVIRSSWMRISTAAKIDQPLSPIYRRVRAGRKGIGRFSVQRLGKKLHLETKPLGEAQGLRVVFNWDDAFKPGRDLSAVFSHIERFDKKPHECGTTLRIFDLRDAWSAAAISKVWRSVLLLQPPFPVKPVASALTKVELARVVDPGFSVVINGKSTEQTKLEYSIDSTFLPQSFATITAQIDGDGNASVRVVSPKADLNDLQVFPEKYLLTGALKFSARYFIYLPSTLSGMNAAVAAEMGRTFGGIRVYRNGFRVLPYGETTDDWLEVDADVSRRHLLIPANNRNFYGAVELSSDENPLFEETSSREGLLENEAYAELKRFVRNAIEWAAKRIAAARNRKQDAGQLNFTREPKKPSEFLRSFREQIGGAAIEGTVSTTVLAEAEAIAAKFEEKVERDRAQALEYEEMLRLLASLGLSISVFGHEVKGARDAMAARMGLLEEAIETAPDGALKQNLHRQQRELSLASDRMFDIGGYIAGLMSSTESRQLRTISVQGALEGFAGQFSAYMGKQGVKFEVFVNPRHLRTTLMHSSELDSVLLNFLTNAIKSMKQSRVDGRRVKMDGRRDGRYVVIGFEDNGQGVAEEDAERVFDAFFTTTMAADDDGVAGPGTGLGLKIVADIAMSYGGYASMAEPSEGYNCRFEFRVLAEGAAE